METLYPASTTPGRVPIVPDTSGVHAVFVRGAEGGAPQAYGEPNHPWKGDRIVVERKSNPHGEAFRLFCFWTVGRPPSPRNRANRYEASHASVASSCCHGCEVYVLLLLVQGVWRLTFLFSSRARRQIRDRVLFVHTPVKRIDIGGTDDIVRVLLEEAPKQARGRTPTLTLTLSLESEGGIEGGRD